MAGVFVKTTRRKRGDKTYEYLSLVEAVRDGERTGHRTLMRLGEVSALQSSGQLAWIVQVAGELGAAIEQSPACLVNVIGLFGFQRGVIVGSRVQLGRPA